MNLLWQLTTKMTSLRTRKKNKLITKNILVDSLVLCLETGHHKTREVIHYRKKKKSQDKNLEGDQNINNENALNNIRIIQILYLLLFILYSIK